MSVDRTILRFGPYELDEARLELRREGARIRIQSRPLALLRYLLRHSDRVVSHAEILREVWPDVHVEPGVLKSAVHALRRALAHGCEPDADGAWIESVHGHGYRFTGAVAVEASLPALRALGSSDFVAREAELATLRALLEAALDGERGIALIGGAPGIGKTRMAMELARKAETLGFETLVGRTHGGAGAPPFWPWAQIVRGWALSHGPERLAELAGAGPGEPELLGLAPARAGGEPDSYRLPGRVQFQTLERVSRFFERAAQERPQLLILDDLHRADSASIELLEFLARHVVSARLLVLATHRPLEPGHPLGRVLQGPATSSIALGPLERSDIEQLLGLRAAPGTVERIHARSGGNPLFAYELARAARAGEALDGPLPARIHDAVRARICECSAATLKLLCLASVGGPDLTLPLLREALAAELGGATLLETLEEAERRDLLVCSAGGYRFVHGIVRETLHAKLGPAERARLRRQLDDASEAFQAGERAPRSRSGHPRGEGARPLVH